MDYCRVLFPKISPDVLVYVCCSNWDGHENGEDSNLLIWFECGSVVRTGDHHIRICCNLSVAMHDFRLWTRESSEKFDHLASRDLNTTHIHLCTKHNHCLSSKSKIFHTSMYLHETNDFVRPFFFFRKIWLSFCTHRMIANESVCKFWLDELVWMFWIIRINTRTSPFANTEIMKFAWTIRFEMDEWTSPFATLNRMDIVDAMNYVIELNYKRVRLQILKKTKNGNRLESQTSPFANLNRFDLNYKTIPFVMYK